MARHRKLARREPNGRIQRVKPDDRAHVINWPSRRHLPKSVRLDQKAATPLGGLNLLGEITDEQYAAGLRFAIVVHRYRAVIGAPHPAPGGMDRCGHGFISPDDRRRRKEAYDVSYETLDPLGMATKRAVNRVSVYDEACPPGGMESLRLGLSALAEHFGLTSRRKSARMSVS
jgi:hypothetical protein